jgi:hypothetical protein
MNSHLASSLVLFDSQVVFATVAIVVGAADDVRNGGIVDDLIKGDAVDDVTVAADFFFTDECFFGEDEFETNFFFFFFRLNRLQSKPLYLSLCFRCC